MNNDEFFKNKIGIIGAGNIGQALALKLKEKKVTSDNLLVSYNGSIFTFSNLYDKDLVDNIADNSRIVDECDIIILSVTPQQFSQIEQFNLNDDTLVISFMAGITIDELQKQTGSSNIIRIIPTGPDTICDETAIAGAYPQQDITDYIFDLLGFDVYNVKNEDELKYMSVAGCLPAVFTKVDLDTNLDDIKKFAVDFPDFIEIAKKADELKATENKDEFIKSFMTKGGITEAIINSLDDGDSLYDALVAGLKRNDELS